MQKKSRAPLKMQALEILRLKEVPVANIIDVGVLHGTPELVSVWPDRKHFLFEPVAEFTANIEDFYRNIEHTLVQVAVGNSNERTYLKVESKFSGSEISHSRMIDSKGVGESALRVVDRITLDSYFCDLHPEISPPFLLKIDIDGRDLEVLQGAKRLLLNCSVVIVECQVMQLAKLVSHLQSAGFGVFDLAEPCYYDGVLWQCDGIFIRQDLLQNRFKNMTDKVEAGIYETFRGF